MLLNSVLFLLACNDINTKNGLINPNDVNIIRAQNNIVKSDSLIFILCVCVVFMQTMML